MPSFWSGRDDEGELGVPGMHCTVGHLSETHFGICCSIVLNKQRYIVEPPDCLDLSNTKGAQAIPKDRCHSWLAAIDNCAISSKVHQYITNKYALSAHRQLSRKDHAPELGSHKRFQPYVPRGNKRKKHQSLTSWNDWDFSAWDVKPSNNYSGYKEPTEDWSSLQNFLSSNALRKELQAIMDLIYSSNHQVYADKEPFSQSQLEAITAARDILFDIFEVLNCHPGSELAIICALQQCFNVDPSPEVLDLLDYLEL
jgi:hypothetical protein